MPSYTGLTVHLGPPKTVARMRRACWNENSATARQVRREIRSTRQAISSSPSISRYSRAL